MFLPALLIALLFFDIGSDCANVVDPIQFLSNAGNINGRSDNDPVPPVRPSPAVSTSSSRLSATAYIPKPVRNSTSMPMFLINQTETRPIYAEPNVTPTVSISHGTPPTWPKPTRTAEKIIQTVIASHPTKSTLNGNNNTVQNSENSNGIHFAIVVYFALGFLALLKV